MRLFLSLVYLITLAACSSEPLPTDWFRMLQAHPWQKTSASTPGLRLIIGDHRYMVLQSTNELLTQGGLQLEPKAGEIRFFNEKGGSVIQFKQVSKERFVARGKLELAIGTFALDGSYERSSVILKPPTSTTLEQAAKFGDLYAAQRFIKQKISPDGTKPQSVVPLAAAVYHHHNRVVEYLLAQRANPNLESGLSQTPLIFAILSGNVAGAKLLIKAGAKVNVKDREGVSLLHKALEQNSLEVVKLLVGHGAGLYEEDSFGFTALYRAMATFSLSKSEVVERLDYTRYLIEEARYNIQHKDRQGRTVLHYAANLGLKDTVDYLLSKGLDPNVPDTQGQTVFDYISDSDEKDKVLPSLLKYRR